MAFTTIYHNLLNTALAQNHPMFSISHFILKDKVKHDIFFTLKAICSCWLQEKGDTYLADHGDKHNLLKYSFVKVS